MFIWSLISRVLENPIGRAEAVWLGWSWGSIPAGLSPLLGSHIGTQRRMPLGKAAAGPGDRAY